MKIQIDFDNKIIKLENNVNLKEFFDKIKNVLSEDWEKYTLETNTVINNWSNPIIIKDYVPYTPYPTYPAYPHHPFWCGTTNTIADNLQTGTYNFELN